jgi:hypothetical protein
LTAGSSPSGYPRANQLASVSAIWGIAPRGAAAGKWPAFPFLAWKAPGINLAGTATAPCASTGLTVFLSVSRRTTE